MTSGKDCYEILGVTNNATKKEIKKAYRSLAKKFHPDINQSPDADEKFKKINDCYWLLSKKTPLPSSRLIDMYVFVTSYYNSSLNVFISKYKPSTISYLNHPILTPLATGLYEYRKQITRTPYYMKSELVNEGKFRQLIEPIFSVYLNSLKDCEDVTILTEPFTTILNLFKSIDAYWGNTYYSSRMIQTNDQLLQIIIDTTNRRKEEVTKRETRRTSDSAANKEDQEEIWEEEEAEINLGPQARDDYKNWEWKGNRKTSIKKTGSKIIKYGIVILLVLLAWQFYSENSADFTLSNPDIKRFSEILDNQLGSKKITIPLLQSCDDGTYYGRCSNDKPNKCVEGALIPKPSECGCPTDYRVEDGECIKIQRCSDSTIYGECSNKKPLFCFDGQLINKASICGCSLDEIVVSENCVSKYLIGPKKVKYEYILRGETVSFDFTVYRGLNDYLSELPRSIMYYEGEPKPSEKDFILKEVNNEPQNEFLTLLVEQIKSQTNSKDDQARIAVSVVQNIPYDEVGFQSGNLKGRYPYEVAYATMGVCGEKSNLLVFLLRDIGYGTAIFSFEVENHAAAGIKCPVEYSYRGTGYCFIETTGPTIITDSEREYVNAGKLTSTPDVIVISEGLSFDSVEEEYQDKLEYLTLEKSSPQNNYQKWLNLRQKYGLEEKSCDKNYRLCNGQCWRNCDSNQVFKCTSKGVVCEWDPNNCPTGTVSCNGECWQSCPRGVFKCTSSGPICQL